MPVAVTLLLRVLVADLLPNKLAAMLRDDNTVSVLGAPFGAGFNLLGGSRNQVLSTGGFSFAGALGVNDQRLQSQILQNGFGIMIRTPFNALPPVPPPMLPPAGGNVVGTTTVATGSNANVLAAGGTQGNRFRLNSTDSNTNGVAASGTQGNRVRASLNAASNRPETTSPGGSVHKSVSDHITKWAKKFSDPDSRGTGGRAKDAKADADSTSGCDK